jgi:multidrug resistance protein
MSTPSFTAAARLRFIVILGALTAFSPLSIDMYLPAFPAIEADFGVGASAVQATLATFFIGLAFGQALYGPIADRYGRRIPLVAGITVYVLASLAAAAAPSIEALTLARLAQALGGCAGVVIARAMVRDLFHEREAAQVFSHLMLVMGVAPILAPVLGAYVLELAEWPAIFWVLGAFGIICILAVWLGPVWGIVPAWVSTFASGLVSGMPAGVAALFALATPVELLLVWSSMVVLDIAPDLRRGRDLAKFAASGGVGAVASSLAALIYVDSRQLGLVESERIWQGWVLGDLLQLVVLAPLLLHFAGPTIRFWLDRQFPVPPRSGLRYTSSVALTAVIVVMMVVLVFLGANLVLDSLAASPELQTPTGDALMTRVRALTVFLGLLAVVAVFTTIVFAAVLARRGERERHVALRDPLTGCFNRRAFYGLFQKESDRSRRLGAGISLIFLDIDHFKRLNDAYGHEIGDRVLEQLARRVQHTLREHDLLFRWGGEEFLVLLPHSTEADAVAVAERIRHAVSDDPLVRADVAQPIRVTLSLGAAGTAVLPADPDALIAQADAAAYLAKYNGRDRVEPASALDGMGATGKI